MAPGSFDRGLGGMDGYLLPRYPSIQAVTSSVDSMAGYSGEIFTASSVGNSGAKSDNRPSVHARIYGNINTSMPNLSVFHIFRT